MAKAWAHPTYSGWISLVHHGPADLLDVPTLIEIIMMYRGYE